METSNTDQQPKLNQPSPQIQPSSNIVPNQKGNFIILIGVVFLILIVGIGAYYLGQQTSKKTQPSGQEQSVTNPSTAPTQPSSSVNTVTTEPAPSLPSGWTYKSNGECAVKFAIPPKQAPYYQIPDPNRQPSVTNDEGSGRFWDFPRGGVYPNLLSKLITGNQEYKQAPTMYATVEGASGYVSSGVIVSCIPNSSNLNNLSMLNSLKSKLQEYNNGTSEKGMQASKYTIKTSNEVSRWNQKVYDLNMSEYYSNSGGQPVTNSVEYTMFTTPKFIYEVRVMGATDNAFVKETAKKIFDNLVFE